MKIIKWIIIAVIILLVGYFLLTQFKTPRSVINLDEQETQGLDLDNAQESTSPSLDDAPESDFKNLDSSDSIFNEIDETLEFLE